MRTLLAITAGAVATAVLIVLCEARPGQPLLASSATAEQACDCNASAQDRLEAGCFLWCPLDFDDDGARGDDDD